MLTALLLSLLAADVPAYLVDEHVLDTPEQRDLLTATIKNHFGATINLNAAHRFYCSRRPTDNGGKLDTCTLREIGICTRQQYADAKKAGINNIRVLKLDGDTVTYRRTWNREIVDKQIAPIVVTPGARRDSLVAYLRARHPDVTLEFLLDVAVSRQPGDAIKSRAVYLGVIDDINTAQLDLDGKLHRLAPGES